MFSLLLFSLFTGHFLQCYTCRDLTPVEKCQTIENCTETEIMCKTTMYSLEDGKDNSLFIHTFNRNQCSDSAGVETSSSFHLNEEDISRGCSSSPAVVGSSVRVKEYLVNESSWLMLRNNI